MSKHAVAIGVSKAGRLRELPGAINGAKDFESWARAQGYKTTLITDKDGPVMLASIAVAISDILKKDFPDRLLVYFAGHGAQLNTTMPVWLLSKWETENGEAVDVENTCRFAQRSGVPRIAFFSDACRSVSPDTTTLSPLPIFPRLPENKNPRLNVLLDKFYSCRLGEIAQEVNAAGNLAAYGVFSRCLVDALSGKEKDAIELNPAPGVEKAVTSQQLDLFLKTAVPLESGKIPNAEVQIPEGQASWWPDRIYNPGPFPAPPPTPPEESAFHIPETDLPASIVLGNLRSIGAQTVAGSAARLKAALEKLEEDAARAKVAAVEQKVEQQFQALTQEFDAVAGHRSAELHTGFTIVGDIPEEAIVSGLGRVAPADIFAENDAYQIRGPGDDLPRSIAIRLSSGNWLATAYLPGFLCAILVKDGAAAGLFYVLPKSDDTGDVLVARQAASASRWTALMHQGRAASRDELQESAEDLRQSRHFNPTLGLLAAYAYERAGDLNAIEGLAGSFAMTGLAVPFDVALLAEAPIEKSATGALRVETTLPSGEKRQSAVAGSFPLLSRGWSLLDPQSDAFSPKLFNLRPHLVRSLWTTLSPEGGRALAELVLKGEL